MRGCFNPTSVCVCVFFPEGSLICKFWFNHQDRLNTSFVLLSNIQTGWLNIEQPAPSHSKCFIVHLQSLTWNPKMKGTGRYHGSYGRLVMFVWSSLPFITSLILNQIWQPAVSIHSFLSFFLSLCCAVLFSSFLFFFWHIVYLYICIYIYICWLFSSASSKFPTNQFSKRGHWGDLCKGIVYMSGPGGPEVVAVFVRISCQLEGLDSEIQREMGRDQLPLMCFRGGGEESGIAWSHNSICWTLMWYDW